MPNGRCKLHGGKSTGPRTPQGLERVVGVPSFHAVIKPFVRVTDEIMSLVQ